MYSYPSRFQSTIGCENMFQFPFSSRNSCWSGDISYNMFLFKLIHVEVDELTICWFRNSIRVSWFHATFWVRWRHFGEEIHPPPNSWRSHYESNHGQQKQEEKQESQGLEPVSHDRRKKEHTPWPNLIPQLEITELNPSKRSLWITWLLMDGGRNPAITSWGQNDAGRAGFLP